MKPYACVVVTYFPDKRALDNLFVLAETSDLLVIVDNTPNPSCVPFPDSLKTTLIANGKNSGLAAALNQGIAIAGGRGYENIFLFDQDSRVSPSFFCRMLAFKDFIEHKTSRCALWAPNFYDRNSGSYARFPVIRRRRFRHYHHSSAPKFLLASGVIAITSGSLLPYSTFQSIGPLPEHYFIDFIDNEYCLRIARHGLLVAINFEVVLDHAIGYRQSIRCFGLTFKPNNHKPVRRYYIARNGICTAMAYFGPFPAFSALVALRLLHELLTVILFENNKFEKIKAMLKGCKDALAGRGGPWGAGH